MTCSSACGYHGNVFLVFVINGIHLSEDFNQLMAVHRFQWRLKDLNAMVNTIDIDHNILFGFALQFDGIKSRKLQERAKETTYIAVDGNVGQRGDGNTDGFSCS